MAVRTPPSAGQSSPPPRPVPAQPMNVLPASTQRTSSVSSRLWAGVTRLAGTAHKKFVYTSTPEITRTTQTILALLPTYNGYIDTLIRFARGSRDGSPDQVRTSFTSLQPLLAPVRDALDSLLRDIAQDASRSSFSKKYAYSQDDITALRAARHSLDSPVFMDPMEHLTDLPVGTQVETLFTLQHTLNTAFHLTQSRSEGRRAAGLRIAKNIFGNLHYSPTYKPLMEKCFHLVGALRKNIEERRYATHAATTLTLIEETSASLRNLLDTYIRGVGSAAFDAARLQPLLELQAQLIRFRLCTPTTLPPQMHLAHQDTNFLKVVAESDAFLNSWSTGGAVQYLATTHLRKQPSEYLRDALTCLARIQGSTPVSQADVASLVQVLEKIMALNDAAPTLLALSDVIEIPLRGLITRLNSYVSQPVDGQGRLNTVTSQEVKDLALLVKNLLEEKAYTDTGYLATPHTSLSIRAGHRLGSVLTSITYSPSQEIITASLAFESFYQARLNSLIVDTKLRQIARECATALETYLIQADTQNIVPVRERHAIRQVLASIQDIAGIGAIDRNPTGDFATQLLVAKKVLDKWKKAFASGLRRQAPLSQDAVPLRPLRAATDATERFLSACRNPRQDIFVPGQEALRAFDDLSLALRANLLPVSPSATEALQRHLVTVHRTLIPRDGSQISTGMVQRQHIIDVLTPLQRNLQTHLIQYTRTAALTTGSFQHLNQIDLALALDSVSCPSEFRELFSRLKALTLLISKADSNPAVILETTRRSWALLKAIVQSAQEDSQVLATSYNLPLDLARHFVILEKHLYEAIIDSAEGSCDPNSDNFYFFKNRRLLLEGPEETSLTSFKREMLEEGTTSLFNWISYDNTNKKGLLKAPFAELVSGERREVYDFASCLLTPEFLQKSWFYYLQSLGTVEATQAREAPTALIRTQHRLTHAPVSEALSLAESETMRILSPLPRTLSQMDERQLATAAYALALYEHRLNEHRLRELNSTQAPGGLLRVIPRAGTFLTSAIGAPALATPIHTGALTTANTIAASVHRSLITSPSSLQTPLTWNTACPAEFRMLATFLRNLQIHASENDASTIEATTREAHAHLTTLITLAGDVNRENFSRHYNLTPNHAAFIADLYQLRQDLNTAISQKDQGSLNPTDPHFYLSIVPSHNRPTLYRLERLLTTLQHWQNNPPEQGSLVVRGFGPRQPEDLLTERFLQLRWNIYLGQLSSDEQRAYYLEEGERIRRLQPDNPQLAASRTAALTHFATIPDDITTEYRFNSALQLGTLAAHVQQNTASPPQTIGGLAGRLLTLAHDAGHSLSTAATHVITTTAARVLPPGSSAVTDIQSRAQQGIDALTGRILTPLDTAVSTAFHTSHGTRSDAPLRPLALPAPVATPIEQLSRTPALTPVIAVPSPLRETPPPPPSSSSSPLPPQEGHVGVLGNIIEALYNQATGTAGPGVHLTREFNVLLIHLSQLQAAIGISQGTPGHLQNMREHARQAWAILKTILHTCANNREQLRVKYALPLESIDQLFALESSLQRAIQTGPDHLPHHLISTLIGDLQRLADTQRRHEEGKLRHILGQYFVGDLRPVLESAMSKLPRDLLQQADYFYFECLRQTSEEDERACYSHLIAELQAELATPTASDYPQIGPAKQKLLHILQHLPQSPLTPEHRMEVARARGDLAFFKQERDLRELEYAQPSRGLAGIAVDTLRHILRKVGISGVEPILRGITRASHATAHPILESSIPTDVAPNIPLGVEFPATYRDLLHTLTLLQTTAREGIHEDINDMTRRAYAHLRALLESVGFPDIPTIVTRSHMVPSIASVATQLCHLCRDLEQAYTQRLRGFCDPTSEHFYLRETPGRETGTAQGLNQIIKTLEHWRQAADRDGTLVGRASDAIFGSQRPPVRLEQAFYQARCKYLLVMESPDILREYYRQELDRLSALTGTNRELTAVRDRAIALRRALPEAPSPLPPHHLDVMAELLGRFDFLEQEALFTQPQEAGGALATTAAAISGLIQSGASALESRVLDALPTGSNLGLAAASTIRGVAQSLTGRVTDTANRIGDIGRDAIYGRRGPGRPGQPRGSGGPGDEPPPPPPPPGSGASEVDPEPNPARRPAQPGFLGRTASALYDAATGRGGPVDRIRALLRHGYDYFTQHGLTSMPQWTLQQGAAWLAGQLRSYIAKLDRSRDAAIISKLESVLTALDKTAAEGTVDNLGETIDQALQYLGITGGGAPDNTDPFIMDNLDTIETTLSFNVNKGRDNQPVQAMIDHEKAEFIAHTSYFGPLKFLNEVFCKQKGPGLEFYSKMINTARAAGPDKEESALKEAFLNHLEQAGVGPFKRLFIKLILYPFSLWLSRRVLQKGVDNATTWAKEFIQENHKDKSTKFGDQIVERTSGFLAVFQSALRRIAESPTITGTLEHEIANELDNPAVNGGLTREALYAKVASKLVDEFIFPWKKDGSQESLNKATFVQTERLWNYFWNIHPAVAITSLILLPGWVVLWLGQTFVHWIISRITKSFLDGKVVDTLISESLGSMRTHGGYTHALNKVLLEQLQEVLVKMQKHFGKLPQEDEDTDGEPKIDPKNMSLVQKEKFRTLVQELFNILPKLECGSPSALRNLLHNKSLLQQGMDGFDEKFIYSKVTESAMELLGLAFQTLLEKGQMERLLYKLMAAANGVYKQDAPVDPAEFQATEERLAHTLNSILDLAVDNSINETLDFNREHETRVADKFTHTLQTLVKDLLVNLDSKFEEFENARRIARSRGMEEQASAASILKEMLDMSQGALQKLLQLRYDIQSSDALKDGKAELLNMIKALNENIRPIMLAISNMQRPLAERDFGEQIAETVGNLQVGFTNLSRAFATQNWAEGLSHIPDLRQHARLLQSHPAIAVSCSELEHILSETERHATIGQNREKDLGIVSNQLIPGMAEGAFALWYQGIGNTLTRTELQAWRQNEAVLHRRIQELGCSQVQKNKFMSLLRAIQAAGTHEARRQEALALWSQELGEYETTLQNDIRISQETLHTTLSAIEPLFAQMTSFSQVDIPGTPESIQQGLEDLRTWIPENIKTPVLAPSRLPGKDIIARGVKHLVGGKIKAKVHSAVNLVRKDYIWRYGVVHHNVALPFVRA